VRQEPVGPFFADFLCRAHKLIVEIDGATHETSKERFRDDRRTAYLNRLGYIVVRFTNADIYESLDHTVEIIRRSLTETVPHPPTSLREAGPNPLPAARGEGK